MPNARRSSTAFPHCSPSASKISFLILRSSSTSTPESEQLTWREQRCPSRESVNVERFCCLISFRYFLSRNCPIVLPLWSQTLQCFLSGVEGFQVGGFGGAELKFAGGLSGDAVKGAAHLPLLRHRLDVVGGNRISREQRDAVAVAVGRSRRFGNLPAPLPISRTRDCPLAFFLVHHHRLGDDLHAAFGRSKLQSGTSGVGCPCVRTGHSAGEDVCPRGERFLLLRIKCSPSVD